MKTGTSTAVGCHTQSGKGMKLHRFNWMPKDGQYGQRVRHQDASKWNTTPIFVM